MELAANFSNGSSFSILCLVNDLDWGYTRLGLPSFTICSLSMKKGGYYTNTGLTSPLTKNLERGQVYLVLNHTGVPASLFHPNDTFETLPDVHWTHVTGRGSSQRLGSMRITICLENR